MKPETTEAAFTDAIVDLAHLYGWLVYHPRPAQYRDGRYATHFKGDAGYPDLTLVSPKGWGVIMAELKVGKNKPTAYQKLWLRSALRNGTEVYVWTPDDWPTITRRLANPKPLGDDNAHT